MRESVAKLVLGAKQFFTYLALPALLCSLSVYGASCNEQWRQIQGGTRYEKITTSRFPIAHYGGEGGPQVYANFPDTLWAKVTNYYSKDTITKVVTVEVEHGAPQAFLNYLRKKGIRWSPPKDNPLGSLDDLVRNPDSLQRRPMPWLPWRA